MTTRTEPDVTATVPETPGRTEKTGRTGGVDLGRLWDAWGMTACLAVLIVVAAVMEPDFLTLANIQSVLTESAYLGIVAAAMTVAIINGTFDLSVGGQLALVSVVSLMGYEAGGTASRHRRRHRHRSRLRPGQRHAGHAASGCRRSSRRSACCSSSAASPTSSPRTSPQMLPYTEIDSALRQARQHPTSPRCRCRSSSWWPSSPPPTSSCAGPTAGRRIVAYGSSPEAARFCRRLRHAGPAAGVRPAGAGRRDRRPDLHHPGLDRRRRRPRTASSCKRHHRRRARRHEPQGRQGRRWSAPSRPCSWWPCSTTCWSPAASSAGYQRWCSAAC